MTTLDVKDVIFTAKNASSFRPELERIWNSLHTTFLVMERLWWENSKKGGRYKPYKQGEALHREMNDILDTMVIVEGKLSIFE